MKQCHKQRFKIRERMQQNLITSQLDYRPSHLIKSRGNATQEYKIAIIIDIVLVTD
jgi:uncharacterized protein (UPF0303 family)